MEFDAFGRDPVFLFTVFFFILSSRDYDWLASYRGTGRFMAKNA